MKKLHVKTPTGWRMVFCACNGQVVQTEDARKALPTKSMWAQDDLQHFANRFANQEFALLAPVGATA